MAKGFKTAPADIGDQLRQAVAYHQAGNLAAAEPLYREILRRAAQQSDALHWLGMLLHQKGDGEAGLRLVERSLKFNPAQAAALNTRGLILGHLGRHAEALASFDNALALRQDYPVALNNRGNALLALNRHQDAAASYGRAIALAPNYAEAICNRANVLSTLKHHDAALEGYARAIALQPGFVDAHFNQANTFADMDRPAEALAGFDRVIRLQPNHQEALFRRGHTLRLLGRFEESLASYDQALSLTPDRSDLWNDRGAALKMLSRYDDARTSFERAVQLKSDSLEALLNLAQLAYLEGRQSDALAYVAACLDAAPRDRRARFLQTVYTLPVISRDSEEAARSRDLYESRLRSLCDDIERDGDQLGFVDVIGTTYPFFLAYQGREDRALHAMFGSLTCSIMAEQAPPPALPAPPQAGARIRVGIVSGFFHRHTVWFLMLQGWIAQLDRTRFEVFAYDTGTVRDDATARTAELCEGFVQGPMSGRRWAQVIAADQPHVLIYPEIGMDPVATKLAAQRLAPVQCSCWGHPVTSGFPTLDYFLTSDAMEPPGGEASYTETLVRLPNLGIYYEPQDMPDIALTRAELGLDADSLVFWCGQSLFKYLPEYDDVFPQIAGQAGRCTFVFIEYVPDSRAGTIFRERLAAAFARHGLDAAHFCVFLPRLTPAQFIRLFSLCDVVLDSIGWSGGQTTLESLNSNLPIVSMPGTLMRSRHTAAMLQLMDLPEMVADSVEAYVAIAARLAHDPAWRQAIRDRVAAGKHRLFRDRAAIDGLEAFLDSAVRNGAA